jgi:hypothetical protein
MKRSRRFMKRPRRFMKRLRRFIKRSRRFIKRPIIFRTGACFPFYGKFYNFHLIKY